MRLPATLRRVHAEDEWASFYRAYVDDELIQGVVYANEDTDTVFAYEMPPRVENGELVERTITGAVEIRIISEWQDKEFSKQFVTQAIERSC